MDALGTLLAVALVIAVCVIAGIRRGRTSPPEVERPDFPQPRAVIDPPPPEPPPAADIWRGYAPPVIPPALALPDLPGGRPATVAQEAAVARLGLRAEGLTYGQANVLLSARDYADTLIARTARIEPASARMRLIRWLVEDAGRITYVTDWSWHTRAHDIRRVPRDDFRAQAEAYLKTLR